MQDEEVELMEEIVELLKRRICYVFTLVGMSNQVRTLIVDDFSKEETHHDTPPRLVMKIQSACHISDLFQ